MNKFILLLLLMVFASPLVQAGITNNFTSIEPSDGFTSYVFAFDNSLDNYMVITFLLAMAIVASVAIYSWSEDFIMSVQFALFITTFLAFLSAVVVLDGQRLLSWEKFSFFATLLVLVSIYKKVSDA